MKKNIVFQAYSKLPLWGKIAVPAAMAIFAVVVYNTIKPIVGILLLAGIAFGLVSFYHWVAGTK